MSRLRTHYDRLEIPRTASPEEIAAAYRRLGKKYHPDLNGGDRECARIMGLIIESNAVLSNPLKRREHDLWIMRKEAAMAALQPKAAATAQPPKPMPNAKAKPAPKPRQVAKPRPRQMPKPKPKLMPVITRRGRAIATAAFRRTQKIAGDARAISLSGEWRETMTMAAVGFTVVGLVLLLMFRGYAEAQPSFTLDNSQQITPVISARIMPASSYSSQLRDQSAETACRSASGVSCQAASQ